MVTAPTQPTQPTTPATPTQPAPPVTIVPALMALKDDPGRFQYYWQRLAMPHPRHPDRPTPLAYRLCDVQDPQYQDVLRMIHSPVVLTFMVDNPGRPTGRTVSASSGLDNPPYPATPPVLDHNGYIAEFTLEHNTGRAWQIHFSISVDNWAPNQSTPELNVTIARLALHTVFHLWNPAQRPLALYGLTPRTNRAAVRFNRRVGFRKQGVLPCGIQTCYNPSKPVDDAIIFVATPDDFKDVGWTTSDDFKLTTTEQEDQ